MKVELTHCVSSTVSILLWIMAMVIAGFLVGMAPISIRTTRMGNCSTNTQNKHNG